MNPEDVIDDGIFWHTCEEPGCEVRIEFDDEPTCYKHSPDEGSHIFGYSAREQASEK